MFISLASNKFIHLNVLIKQFVILLCLNCMSFYSNAIFQYIGDKSLCGPIDLYCFNFVRWLISKAKSISEFNNGWQGWGKESVTNDKYSSILPRINTQQAKSTFDHISIVVRYRSFSLESWMQFFNIKCVINIYPQTSMLNKKIRSSLIENTH